jgi:hypothetical protein
VPGNKVVRGLLRDSFAGCGASGKTGGKQNQNKPAQEQIYTRLFHGNTLCFGSLLNINYIPQIHVWQHIFGKPSIYDINKML